MTYEELIIESIKKANPDATITTNHSYTALSFIVDTNNQRFQIDPHKIDGYFCVVGNILDGRIIFSLTTIKKEFIAK